MTANSSMMLNGFHLIKSSLLNLSTVLTITVFVALLCACIVIGHLLEQNRWANASIVALLLGLASGSVLLLVTKGQSPPSMTFNEELFFIYLLPPIIFNAGFQVKKKQFFKNFSVILLFGIFGTIISFCLISLGSYLLIKEFGDKDLTVKDCLAIGAILSATDSVCTLQVLSQEQTPFLYSVVFGEGVVNDATSIVLFNAVQSINFSDIDGMTALKLLGNFLYLFFTSTALGIAAGLLSAFGTKTLYFGRHSTDREVAIMMLMAYLSYLVAELLSLSGILTIFFCGIVMSHYTWYNITESSRVITKHAFATLSFIAETFIFLYVGIDALDIQEWKENKASAGTSIAFIVSLFALVLIGRGAFVYPISNILNCVKRGTDKIEMKQQFIIWWAGLIRGSVTIALAFNQFSTSGSEHSVVLSCIIIIVLFSTLIFGSVTKPLIQALLNHPEPRTSEESDTSSAEDLSLLFLENGGPDQSAPRRSNLEILMRYPIDSVHYFWRKFDDKFMRPVFGGQGFVPFAPGSPNREADE